MAASATRRAIPHAAFAVLASLVAGCVLPRNISNDPGYPTDYVAGATYRTLRPMVAWASRTPIEEWLNLSGSLQLVDPVPSQASLYVGTPVPTGTLVRLEKLQRTSCEGWATCIWVVGRFIDGPLAGKDIDLTSVSNIDYEKFEAPQVDPKRLELVQ